MPHMYDADLAEEVSKAYPEMNKEGEDEEDPEGEESPSDETVFGVAVATSG